MTAEAGRRFHGVTVAGKKLASYGLTLVCKAGISRFSRVIFTGVVDQYLTEYSFETVIIEAKLLLRQGVTIARSLYLQCETLVPNRNGNAKPDPNLMPGFYSHVPFAIRFGLTVSLKKTEVMYQAPSSSTSAAPVVRADDTTLKLSLIHI